MDVIITLVWFIFMFLIALLAVLGMAFKPMKYIVLSILIVPLLLSLLFITFKHTTHDTVDKRTFFNRFTVGAHRGSHMKFPENSIKSFEQAKLEGADLVEFDIQETKDGVAIINHDTNTLATTGRDLEISETDWIVLKNLTLLSKNNGTTKYRMPSFAEAVKWCVDNDMMMLWDVKSASSKLIDTFESTIRENNIYDKVIVSSFNPIICYRVKNSNPRILTGFTWMRWYFAYVDEKGDEPRYGPSLFWLTATLDNLITIVSRSLLMPSFLGVDMLLTNHYDADWSLILESNRSGIRVVSWTINNAPYKKYTESVIRIPYLTDDPSILPGPH